MNPVQDGADRLVIVAAAWFDGERRHDGGPTTLVVEDRRLVAIAEGDQTAALAGNAAMIVRVPFLMPGLVDAHVHLFLEGHVTDNALRAAHLKKPVEELTETARDSARRARACGVTLVRDAGDRYGINHVIRTEAGAATEFARVRSAGAGLRRPQRYGSFIAREVGDDASIREAIAALAPDCDEIKLVLTGIIDFAAGAVTDEPQFDLEAAKLVVATAGQHGRRTLAHCSGAAGLAIATAAGVGSIEHGFFMNRETLAVMRDRQIAWTPTFCPVHFQWAQPEAGGWSATTIGHLRRILDEHAGQPAAGRPDGRTLAAGDRCRQHGRRARDGRHRRDGPLAGGRPVAGTDPERRHGGTTPPFRPAGDAGAPGPVRRAGAAGIAVH